MGSVIKQNEAGEEFEKGDPEILFACGSLLVLPFQSFYFRPCWQVHHMSGTSAAPLFWCQAAAHCPRHCREPCCLDSGVPVTLVTLVPMAAKGDHSTRP